MRSSPFAPHASPQLIAAHASDSDSDDDSALRTAQSSINTRQQQQQQKRVMQARASVSFAGAPRGVDTRASSRNGLLRRSQTAAAGLGASASASASAGASAARAAAASPLSSPVSPMQRVAAVWSPRHAFMHEFIVKEDAEERMRDAEQRARERAVAEERARRAEEILSRVMLPDGEYERAAPPNGHARPSVVLARARSAPGIAPNTQLGAVDAAAQPQPLRETPVPPPSPEVVAADAPAASAVRDASTDNEALRDDTPHDDADGESMLVAHAATVTAQRASALRRTSASAAAAFASSPTLPPRPPAWAR